MPGRSSPRENRTMFGSSLLKKSVRVYHHGEHTKPVAQKPEREIERQLTENPALTPSAIQSNLIVSQMRKGNKVNKFFCLV